MNRQLFELVFHPVQRLAETQRCDATQQSQYQVERQGVRESEVERAHLEHGASSHQPEVDTGRQGAGDNQRDERSRLEFKQQQFDG